MLRMILLGVIGLSSATAAYAETPMTLKDPAVLLQQLQEMGYSPDTFDLSGDNPTTVLHLDNETMALVLGGCTAKKNCSYAAVVGHFTDVKNLPADWIAKENENFDLIKVWSSDGGQLNYASSAMIEGLPRATFRQWIDQVSASSSQLGTEALKVTKAK